MGKGEGEAVKAENKTPKAEDVGEVTDQRMAEMAKSDNDLPYSMREKVMFFFGLVLLCTLLPFSVVLIGTTVLWDGLDRGFMGRPQDGLTMMAVRVLNRFTEPWFKNLVRKPEDAFIVNVVFLQGVVLPCVFFYCFYQTMTFGFSVQLCFVYHVFRLGPYFMSFAYAYTNCHKECHSHLGIFKKSGFKPLDVAAENVFNWWIGLYYGTIPSSFSVGHAINHHKYNNGPGDVVSTADKPRDNWMNFVCFIARQFLYATNVSTVIQFWEDKEYDTAIWMNVGTVWYVTWIYVFYTYSPLFALFYIFFPLAENVLLLAAIGWAWHAFVNPDDPEDDTVGSITIFNGPIQVQGEDYHVVHHRYPGAHWTEHEALLKQDKDKGEYDVSPGSQFTDTHAFEVFFFVILRKYDLLAEKFVDKKGTLTMQDKINLIKVRLRTCWWGPRRNTAIKLTGREVRRKKD